MPASKSETLERGLGELRSAFEVPQRRLEAMISAFHGEMERGLAGEPSSLQMLPAYVDAPSGRETGSFLALDMGGTNVRILMVRLPGGGGEPEVAGDKFKLTPELIAADGDVLFGAIARFIGGFLSGRGWAGRFPLGFTFSFAIRQDSIDRGELVAWTKGWTSPGVEGRDVVGLLNRALVREGVAGVRVAALNNDTTGTLMAGAYRDPACDVGCILGTGTNTCYRERVEAFRKPLGRYGRPFMIVNTESGNFDRELPRNRFDERLDEASVNPGRQREEKLVSGKYLGELTRLTVLELCARFGLFGGRPGPFAEPESFGGEELCDVKADESADATAVRSRLAALGAAGADADDARAVRDAAWMVSDRAARVAAAVLTAVVTRIDPGIERPHALAVDGSVFELHPGFALRMRETFVELLGDRAGSVRMVLTPDGSGLGAAVVAAAAEAEKAGR